MQEGTAALARDFGATLVNLQEAQHAALAAHSGQQLAHTQALVNQVTQGQSQSTAALASLVRTLCERLTQRPLLQAPGVPHQPQMPPPAYLSRAALAAAAAAATAAAAAPDADPASTQPTTPPADPTASGSSARPAWLPYWTQDERGYNSGVPLMLTHLWPVKMLRKCCLRKHFHQKLMPKPECARDAHVL